MPTVRFALAALVLVAGSLSAAAPPVAINSDRVTTLLEALDDDSFDVRQSADEELRAMGRAVVGYLRDEHLRTQSPEVRDRLSRMIHDLNVHERIPHLVRMLTHKDERFRTHAERALRNVPPAELPALEAELKKGSGEGRRKLERIIADISSVGR
jgi:HEAT repeat protein